jgi:hypothetical protein
MYFCRKSISTKMYCEEDYKPDAAIYLYCRFVQFPGLLSHYPPSNDDFNLTMIEAEL